MSESTNLLIIIVGVIAIALIVATVVFQFMNDDNVPSQAENASAGVQQEQLDILHREVESKKVAITSTNSMFSVTNPVVNEMYTSDNYLLGCYEAELTRMNEHQFKVNLWFYEHPGSENATRKLAYTIAVTIPEHTNHYSRDEIANDVLFLTPGEGVTTVSLDILFMYTRYPDGRERVVIQVVPLT